MSIPENSHTPNTILTEKQEDEKTTMKLFEELGLRGCLNGSGITSQNYVQQLFRTLHEIDKEKNLETWWGFWELDRTKEHWEISKDTLFYLRLYHGAFVWALEKSYELGKKIEKLDLSMHPTSAGICPPLIGIKFVLK